MRLRPFGHTALFFIQPANVAMTNSMQSPRNTSPVYNDALLAKFINQEYMSNENSLATNIMRGIGTILGSQTAMIDQYSVNILVTRKY